MKAVLDACVLYPTVMREMLVGAADAGCYTPVWSARILEEWARAAEKLGPLGAAQARAEIALLRTSRPEAERSAAPGIEARLWLPDPADLHVLAVAIDSSADTIVTLNARDFPRATLAEEGVARIDPDAFLYGFWLERPDALERLGARILQQACAVSGQDWTLRALLKKARLPRLAKALG